MRRSVAICIQLAAAVSAIPWFGPAQTIPAAAVPHAPIYTDAPVSHIPNPLLKRDAAPGICGWIEGFSQNAYSCTGTSTCFWNTDHHVIACGVPTSANFQTKCVDYNDLSASCDLSCSFNPSINRCPATIPYCVNITLGGADQPYTAFACGSTMYTSYPEVQLTYSGEITLNYLPRFLDAAGDVSYGTQTPPGYTGASTTVSPTTSSYSSPSSSPSPTSSSQSSQSSAISQTPAPLVPSLTPTPSVAPSSSNNIGAIVGGVVGGVGGIAIIAGIAVYFIIRSRRKKREAGLQQNAQIASETETKAQFPPQSYPGSPGYQASVAPAYQPPPQQQPQQPPQQQQQGFYGQPGYVVPQQEYPQQSYYPQQLGPNELPGGVPPNELQAPQQQFPHQSFHELQ